MLKSIFGIISDVVEVAVAPVEIAATTVRAVTKPIAEGARNITETVKETLEDR